MKKWITSDSNTDGLMLSYLDMRFTINQNAGTIPFLQYHCLDNMSAQYQISNLRKRPEGIS